MVTAENRDAIKLNTMVNPSCLKSWPDIPLNMDRGINTTQVVAVPPMIELIITRLPSMAAS